MNFIEKIKEKLHKKPEQEAIRYYDWLPQAKPKSWKDEVTWYASNPSGFDIDEKSQNKHRIHS
jgi:hypothetical protein